MLDSKTAKLLIDCSNTIEHCLNSKAQFIASLDLQDKVFHNLQLLSEIGRGTTWGYRGMVVEKAWYRINGPLLEQLLLSGNREVDLYKVWKVTTENLPIIKREANFWVNQKGS